MTRMFAHIPKISAGLGCLILGCFFLPWISFSCGTVTFLEFSGYHLTAGKVPINESVIRQYEQRAGKVSEDERVPDEMKGPRPRFIYLIVIICALNIVAFSLKMMDGVIDRWKSMAVMVFGSIGFVFMVAAAILDFGIDIPSGSEMLIQSSIEIGYFGTLFGFSGTIALSLLSIWGAGQLRTQAVLADLQIPEESFSDPGAVGSAETITDDVAEHFGITPQKKPVMRAPVPPGAKTCPGCGTVVGLYQAKCVKCNSAIKPGK